MSFWRRFPAFAITTIAIAGFTVCAPRPAEAAAKAGALRSVIQVRELSPAAAGQARPVAIRGVVTALSGWKTSFFLQDATAGISVDCDFIGPPVAQGQLVEVDGVTSAGMFAPVIRAAKVITLGHTRLPQPKQLPYAELFSGKGDGQWIGVTGLVRLAEIQQVWGQPRLVLTLDIGGGAVITARVHDFNAADITKYDGAIVSIRGVCGTVFNDRRQFIGVRMFVAGTQDVHIDRSAAMETFSAPLRSFDTLLQFREGQTFRQRVRVQGVVTWSKPGEGLYLMDGGQGLYVGNNSPAAVPVGSAIEAVGYPAVGQYSPQLENAILRKIPSAGVVQAKAHSASEMIVVKDGFASAPFDATLVTLRGRLVEEVPSGKDELLLMEDGDVFFTAKLTHARMTHMHFGDNSVLQLTGVCVAVADQSRDAQTFSLLLRDKNDIVVLKNPPWWNAKHATWVFAVLLLVLVLSFVFLAIRRHHAYLRELAVTDPLTGLYNRRGFLLLAQQQWQTMQRQKASLLLFYIDLDRFKQINDTFGHQEGDKALQSVTSLLRKTFRKSDIIARMGGDEFSIATIAPSVATAVAVKERLWGALAELNNSGVHPYRLELSMGLVSCDANAPGYGIEELLATADAKMYQEKRRGSEHAPRTHQATQLSCQ